MCQFIPIFCSYSLAIAFVLFIRASCIYVAIQEVQREVAARLASALMEACGKVPKSLKRSSEKLVESFFCKSASLFFM